MDFPDTLSQGIEDLVSRCNPGELKQAARAISLRYRQTDKIDPVLLKTEADHIAYLLTRLPATFAVLARVFQEIQNLIPHVTLTSLLDLGTGPGTSIWAVLNHFRHIQNATLMDQDRSFLHLGQHLASFSDSPVLQTARWQCSDILNADAKPHDLVVVSYAFNELHENVHHVFIQRLWALTQKVLILVEPGTKQGYANILEAREALLSLGGHLIAPCPHPLRCPISGEDWCHFSVRLQRSALHKRLKEGALSFEDEKYAYLVASKSPGPAISSRILRHPLKHKGHIQFTLCTPQGIKSRIVAKSDPAAYKKAKAAGWGDIGDFFS